MPVGLGPSTTQEITIRWQLFFFKFSIKAKSYLPWYLFQSRHMLLCRNRCTQLPVVQALRWQLANYVVACYVLDVVRDISKKKVLRFWRSGANWSPLTYILLYWLYSFASRVAKLAKLVRTPPNALKKLEFIASLNCFQTGEHTSLFEEEKWVCFTITWRWTLFLVWVTLISKPYIVHLFITGMVFRCTNIFSIYPAEWAKW